MLKSSRLIFSVCLSVLQLFFLSAIPISTAEAQPQCNLENESPPSSESREIRSIRNPFKFKIPANYRAVAERDSIIIFSPEAYEYDLCNPPTSSFYMSAWVGVEDSEVSSSASLRQAFDSERMNQQPIQGSIQQVNIAGEPALRYHVEYGGDGLTRNYVLFSPQRTKLITISSWIDSVNAPEPEILGRIVDSFELSFSVTENSPRIGIVPTLDYCGLAVWQNSNDKRTHLLTFVVGESVANVRIDDQALQLRSTGGQTPPELTRNPGNFTFHNSDRSITATLQGNWRTEHPGAEAGWITNNATLKVTKGGQTTELPVFANLGCNFLFY